MIWDLLQSIGVKDVKVSDQIQMSSHLFCEPKSGSAVLFLKEAFGTMLEMQMCECLTLKS